MPETLPTPWATLLPAALAGTRRQMLPALPGFTPTLGAEPGAPEKQLLLTAAGLTLVQRAGRGPLPGPAQVPPPAPPERRPAAPAAIAGRLAALLAETSPEPAAALDEKYVFHQQSIAVEAVLADLRRLGYRLPVATAVRVLGHHWSRGVPLRTVRLVLGERCHWLHQLAGPGTTTWWAGYDHRREAARPVFDQLTRAMWWPMPADESYLPAFARQKPGRRTKLLWQAWQHNAGQALPPSLQEQLTALLAATPAARRPWSELDKLPGLGGHPRLAGRPLLTRLAERTAPLLTLERPATGPPRVRIELPTTWDDQWITVTSPSGYYTSWPAYFHRRPGPEGWLQDLLYYLGPQHWAERWQLPPAEVVALVGAAEHGALVLEAWAHHLRAYNPGFWPQPEFARALLPTQETGDFWVLVHLLPHLTLAERVAWLAAHLPTNLAAPAVPDWCLYLHSRWVPLPEPAGLRLTLPVLAAALVEPRTRANAKQCQDLRLLLLRLAEEADGALYPEVQAALGGVTPLYPSARSALQLLLQTLALRHDLRQACPPVPALAA